MRPRQIVCVTLSSHRANADRERRCDIYRQTRWDAQNERYCVYRFGMNRINPCADACENGKDYEQSGIPNFSDWNENATNRSVLTHPSIKMPLTSSCARLRRGALRHVSGTGSATCCGLESPPSVPPRPSCAPPSTRSCRQLLLHAARPRAVTPLGVPRRTPAPIS